MHTPPNIASPFLQQNRLRQTAEAQNDTQRQFNNQMEAGRPRSMSRSRRGVAVSTSSSLSMTSASVSVSSAAIQDRMERVQAKPLPKRRRVEQRRSERFEENGPSSSARRTRSRSADRRSPPRTSRSGAADRCDLPRLYHSIQRETLSMQTQTRATSSSASSSSRQAIEVEFSVVRTFEPHPEPEPMSRTERLIMRAHALMNEAVNVSSESQSDSDAE